MIQSASATAIRTRLALVLLSVLSIAFFVKGDPIELDFDCYNVQGDGVTGNTRDDLECDSGYVMTDCGYFNEGRGRMDGTETIDDDRCRADNSDGSNAGYSAARCCRIKPFESPVDPSTNVTLKWNCDYVYGPFSPADDVDGTSTITGKMCPNYPNDLMIGCQGKAENNERRLLGYCLSDQVDDGDTDASSECSSPSEILDVNLTDLACIAILGDETGSGDSFVRSQMACCQIEIDEPSDVNWDFDITYDCNYRIGNTQTSDGGESRASCNAGETMLSTGGWSDSWENAGIYPDFDNPNNNDGLMKNLDSGRTVIASVLCCRFYAEFESLSPTMTPTGVPTGLSSPPTRNPTLNPSMTPTQYPTQNPTEYPTDMTSAPSQYPTSNPTRNPTTDPTQNPTEYPTEYPSKNPTSNPTMNPTAYPSRNPTEYPTSNPTEYPSANPTRNPTEYPTMNPTEYPTMYPTDHPSKAPTDAPSQPPTNAPSQPPSAAPTNAPSQPPTRSPSNAPSQPPTNAPSLPPTRSPSQAPTTAPSEAPSDSPSQAPSGAPTIAPTNSPSQPPTRAPTDSPSRSPSRAPTAAPSTAPTENPTRSPSRSPSRAPSNAPTYNPTDFPTLRTDTPTANPTKNPTTDPTRNPTMIPTQYPSKNPTKHPTMAPTFSPVIPPTSAPTSAPTESDESDGFLQSSVAGPLNGLYLIIILVALVICIIACAWQFYKRRDEKYADAGAVGEGAGGPGAAAGTWSIKSDKDDFQTEMATTHKMNEGTQSTGPTQIPEASPLSPETTQAGSNEGGAAPPLYSSVAATDTALAQSTSPDAPAKLPLPPVTSVESEPEPEPQPQPQPAPATSEPAQAPPTLPPPTMTALGVTPSGDALELDIEESDDGVPPTTHGVQPSADQTHVRMNTDQLLDIDYDFDDDDDDDDDGMDL